MIIPVAVQRGASIERKDIIIRLYPWVWRSAGREKKEEEEEEERHATGYGVLGTDYELRITNYEIRITNYELRITDYEIRITDYGLLITGYEGYSGAGPSLL